MKSLGILVLLGTISAISLGAFLAVTPVLAKAAVAPSTAIEANTLADQPVAPVTGSAAEVEAAPETVSEAAVAESAAADPGVVLASTFSINIEKDTASAQAAQEAAAKAAIAAEQQASFNSFVASVSNGKANQVTGIYVKDVLAYSVVRQLSGNGSFVSEDANQVTQFALAAKYGSEAFLAHNYLAGASFFSLSEGQIITLVYGDGSSQQFRIQTIKRFQAISPDSTQSTFVDLESGAKLSNSDLFHSMYNSDNSVVLQTCIAKDGLSTWGRLFVIAVQIDTQENDQANQSTSNEVAQTSQSVNSNQESVNSNGNSSNIIQDTVDNTSQTLGAATGVIP